MSQHFLKLYSEARAAQAVKNEARHIWTKIREARGSPHDAAVRWPFELLQNAVDAGPRGDRENVDIALTATTGCEAAKVRLTSADTLRKSEPDYRLGWNAYGQ